MSLKSRPIAPVSNKTARVACATFPKGNRYLSLRDTLGTIFILGTARRVGRDTGCGRRSHPAHSPVIRSG